jgi:HEAT repeat protein
VNSSANLSEQQRQFLEETARGYGFRGDTETVFRGRFDPANTEPPKKKINKVLVGYLAWNKDPLDKAQKLQDELDKICEVLAQDGCVIKRLSTDERKRGRPPKGRSPWEQAYKWLWEEKFPEWQNRQNLVAPNPSLSEQAQKNVVCRFLQEIENNFKYDKLLHIPEQPIILKDQYIPIQVKLERKYTHAVETTWGYAESEAELKRAYALKGLEESQPSPVDWKEAKKQHQRIIVLADPGMGKSTLLRREACLTAQEERQSLKNNTKKLEDVVFPLFLRLSDLAETPEEIIDAIPVLIQRECSETAKEVMELLREKLKVGKCLLLLDALDEVPTEHRQRQRLIEKLNRFAQRKPPCPIICTSRIVGYSGAFVAGVKEVEIVPFSQKQIEQYIETWFRNAAGYLNDDTVSASSLIRELRNKPQIRGLAQNPLLLSLICSLYQEKGLTLPARRCQVYEQAVCYMLGKWRKKRNPELNDAWIDAKTELLEELAYQFSCDGKEIFTRRELRHKIDKYLRSEKASSDFRDKNASCLIKELSEQDGILQKLNKDSDEQYLFLHRTFQEYLTACYLKQASNGIALAREHFWEYEWHETLSLLAGLMENPVPLLQAITAEKDDIFSTLLLLAGRCIAECQEDSHPLIKEIFARIYKFWQSYPNAGFIESIVVAIAQGSSQMLERLQKALKDENIITRLQAATASGEDLCQILIHKDNFIRLRVARALGQIGNSQAIPALISALDDEDSRVEALAIKALGQIGSFRAVRALTSVLEHKAWQNGTEAVKALSQIDNSQALMVLISALSHKYSHVRTTAAETLGQISNPEAVRALNSALKHHDSDVRRLAAISLGQSGNPQAITTLVSDLCHKDSRVRWFAAVALGMIPSPQAFAALISALNYKESDVRRGAVQVLGEIGNPQAVASLIPLLNDEDRDVRQRTVQALNNIGNSEAVTALISALAHKDCKVRRQAAIALGYRDNALAVAILMCDLNHDNSRVRSQVALHLAYMGNSQAIEALISGLDQNKGPFLEAVWALGQIGNPQAVVGLISALNNREKGKTFRNSVAHALGETGSPQAVATLILTLTDKDWSVRESATRALGKIGNPQAVAALISVLNHEDSNVRREAAEALIKIGTSETLEKVIQLPEIDIYCPDIFPLARTLAVRFSKERLPFIPIYPELVAHKQ